MVPIVIPSRKNRAKEPEPEKTPQHREKAREADAEVRRYVNGVSIAAMCIAVLGGAAGAAALRERPTAAALVALAGLVLGTIVLFSLKIARQWERAVVLHFGKFAGLRGPGFFAIVPIVETVSHLIDQRVRVTDVTAESALTRDTVPVNVDAIVFWTVWDAEKSVLEVADYFDAVSLSAQTALREAIGRHQLAEMITEREKLGKGLQAILDEKTNPWGITVHSVEIRDVKIPPDLEDAMSRQAQAERERQARIILGTAETEIASRFVKAGDEYKDHPLALHLRAMNMLYE
ncbi:MAG TPA: slipin family protein, partial [Thermoanaerobaculia bacterium]|nr:slipin family protein [Thermoanaerobaculia bacterium]